ncbi:hypothetical protein [Sphingomonas sp. LC-1]|uniref:hypothetical protein n=1 Tax=Sphingomonas sp. LC-1 TaxID=3110957 RepID=UPI0021BB592F|nr:hypothetical protein [Sphingomonas sp. LC-1]
MAVAALPTITPRRDIETSSLSANVPVPLNPDPQKSYHADARHSAGKGRASVEFRKISAG